jgi:hypothetical protein
MAPTLVTLALVTLALVTLALVTLALVTLALVTPTPARNPARMAAGPARVSQFLERRTEARRSAPGN